MGITDGNIICEPLCERALLASASHEEILTNVSLYIDGLILLYCGNVKFSSDECSLKRSLAIVRQKLRKIISSVQKRFNVLNVTIFFDGEAPIQKLDTKKKRRSRGSTYDIQKIKNEFLNETHIYRRYMASPIEIQIKNLIMGEAEMEMYRLMDGDTVLYTKDTDMFTIAYGHDIKRGKCFFCQEKITDGKNEFYFYEMDKFFYTGVSKETFTAIMAFAGTDYSESRLSLTQIKCILSGFDSCISPILPPLPLLTMNDLENFVNDIKAFLTFEKYQGAKIRDSQKYDKITDPEYLRRVYWYIQYINGIIIDN